MSIYEHYLAIQAANPDKVVFYQLGDFYEVMGENAPKIADLLNLTLTRRQTIGYGKVFLTAIPAFRRSYIIPILEKKGIRSVFC